MSYQIDGFVGALTPDTVVSLANADYPGSGDVVAKLNSMKNSFPATTNTATQKAYVSAFSNTVIPAVMQSIEIMKKSPAWGQNLRNNNITTAQKGIETIRDITLKKATTDSVRYRIVQQFFGQPTGTSLPNSLAQMWLEQLTAYYESKQMAADQAAADALIKTQAIITTATAPTTVPVVQPQDEIDDAKIAKPTTKTATTTPVVVDTPQVAPAPLTTTPTQPAPAPVAPTQPAPVAPATAPKTEEKKSNIPILVGLAIAGIGIGYVLFKNKK